jgi:hypothetical protein
VIGKDSGLLQDKAAVFACRVREATINVIPVARLATQTRTWRSLTEAGVCTG